LRAYNRELRRKRQAKNPELYKAKVFAQLEKRRDLARVYSREYRARNPVKSAENARRRRALRLGNGAVKYTEKKMLETYGINCHLCLIPIDLNAPRRAGREGWELGLHVDHVIPIFQGGPDTLENVRPAHAKCNLSRPKLS
jgi:5-methylcytosine-specific restriction endonuclease McrA